MKQAYYFKLKFRVTNKNDNNYVFFSIEIGILRAICRRSSVTYPDIGRSPYDDAASSYRDAASLAGDAVYP